MKEENDSFESTPQPQRRSPQTILTKDLIAEPNKFSEEIRSKFAEIVKNDSSFKFLAGFDQNTSVAYLNLKNHLVLFRRTGLSDRDSFEMVEVVPTTSSNILVIKPILFKTFNTTMIVYFDSRQVLISSFTDGRFLASISISKDDNEIESVSELSQSAKSLELVMLDSLGNIYLLEIKADLTYRFVTLEKHTSSIKNLFSSVFSRSEPTNKIRNFILSKREKKFCHIIKFFDNKMVEIVYDTNFSIELKKRPRNLHEYIRQWDLAYLNKNKLVYTDSKTVNYIPISFDKFETTFICVYNIYVMNSESVEIVITKARTIKYSQKQLENLADIIIHEQPGSMYDLIDIESVLSGNELYVVYSFFDSEKGEHHNILYTTDRFFRNLTHRRFRQRIFGCGIAKSSSGPTIDGLFVILDNKFEFMDEENQQSYMKTKFVESSDLKLDFDTHKSKRVNSSSKRSLTGTEANFTKLFEHFFSLFLQRNFDLDYEEDLQAIRDSLNEQDYTNDLKQFMYHIANERNRNLILAIRLIKEDLSVIEERKKELGDFNDIITIELKKKFKKLEKLNELFRIIPLEGHYKDLVVENAAIMDTIQTGLAIRSFQKANWRSEALMKFFDTIFTALIFKWKLDSSDNTDAFYTNLINVQSFFQAFNDTLRSEIEQRVDADYLNDIVKLGFDTYIEVVQKLVQSNQDSQSTINGYKSLLIREDNNMISHLVDFIDLVLFTDSLSGFKQTYHFSISTLIESAINYLYSIKSHLFVTNLHSLIEQLFDYLIKIKHEEQAMRLAIK